MKMTVKIPLTGRALRSIGRGLSSPTTTEVTPFTVTFEDPLPPFTDVRPASMSMGTRKAASLRNPPRGDAVGCRSLILGDIYCGVYECWFPQLHPDFASFQYLLSIKVFQISVNPDITLSVIFSYSFLSLRYRTQPYGLELSNFDEIVPKYSITFRL